MSVASARPGIAIVGMDGRFPKAPNLEQFWRNLCDGVEAISFFSDEELAAAGSPSSGLANFVKARGVLEDADLFDAAFFGMHPKEAEMTDPQHRLFLESAWKALENAGCDPQRTGASIGVFAGMSTNTYLTHNLMARPQTLIGLDGDVRVMLGNEKEFLPTRVSYKLDLKGPSLNIQTGCSTSLVTVCVACQHLLTFQCDLALAGAVSVSFPQKRGYLYKEGAIESPDGHCRPFDTQSAGTVAGEGVGVVALKRLEDALADGDAIYAVIRGFAMNNDGSRKTGYAAPSAIGQSEAIAKAQAMAGFEPRSIGYVEAHGTGTPLGDPIEIEGLSRAFRLGTDARHFCALGSVKGNIGHLDTAAGMAGLIKTALALHHKKLPPSLHYESPNPRIDFAGSPFYVNARLAEWDERGGPRRAGVSSFGIGGTNAHLVLEEAPDFGPSAPSRAVQVLLLSARTGTALGAAAKDLAQHLRHHPLVPLADVAFTLHTGRRQFGQRAMLVCRDAGEAAGALEADAAPRLLTGTPRRENPPVVFMFPGQGAQRLNMGGQLYATETAFRATVDLCSSLLEPHIGLDLRTVLYPRPEAADTATASLDQTALTQPALFVVEYALARLWMSWGISPESMIGHSIGEYVAACLAGVFSLEDALALVAARGRMMQGLPGGTMLAVALPESEVTALLHEELSLAAVNSVSGCILSGPGAAIEKLRQQLLARDVACTVLRTSHAFHSAMMEPILPAFTALVQNLERRPPQIPFVSNRTGTWITESQATDPAYWAGHLRHTVRFADGLRPLFSGERVLLEVGPGQTLSGLARRHPARAAAVPVIASLPQAGEGPNEVENLLAALGQLWVNGVTPDWTAFYAAEKRRRVWLPAYPFERKRFWIEPPLSNVQLPATLPAPARNGSHEERPRDLSTVTATAMLGANGDGRPSEQGGTLVRLRALVGCLSGLDATTLDGEASFTQMGFDSLFLTQLSFGVERDFAVHVAFRQLIQEFSTLNSLAARIDRDGPSQAKPGTLFRRDAVVPIQPKGSGPPLMFVHGAGGGMFWGYTTLSNHLGADQPVYAFEACAAPPNGLINLDEMAASYVDTLRAFQPRGPYYLGGYCFGGNVAYEMACQLHAQGETVALLALIDSRPPNSNYLHARLGLPFCAKFLKNLGFWLAYFVHLKSEHRQEFLRWKFRSIKRKFFPATAGPAGARPFNLRDFVDVSILPEPQRRLWEAHVQGYMRHRHKPYPGHLTLFRSRGHPLVCSFDEALDWRSLAQGGVTVHIVSGAHETIMHEPHVRSLARELQPFLKAPASSPTPAAVEAMPVEATIQSRQNTCVPPSFEAEAARMPDAPVVVLGPSR
jgi:phthiocerol/phenolphthiocerol synthesis type-I polyketide synthase E